MASVSAMAGSRTAAIRRVTGSRSRWRVLVETWEDGDAVRGRLVFRTDAPGVEEERESAALLYGRSHEDVLALAHDLPEERLRQVLNSLS
jgi:hypothetical protein